MTQAELAQAGYDVGAPAHARLAAYVTALLAENEHVNLTAIRDAAELWRGHICDSLALVPLAAAVQARRVLDLGSGGGLPGVPLACTLPDVQVTVLDSVRKKVAAVERAVAAVGLANVVALCGRAEELAHAPAQRERYDAVTARAVAELPVLVEYVSGFVRVGGECWLFKSAAGAQTEVPAARRAASQCGLVHARTVAYRVPGDTTDRALVVYRKERPLDPRLPRGVGQAKKKAL